MSISKSSISWLKQTFAWSNSWPSWQERLVLLAFFAIAGALGYVSVRVVQTQGPQMGVIGVLGVVWAAFFVAVVVSSWLGWLKLFGPVLFYDMVRTARRSRYVLMRLLYANLLLIILCVIFFTANEMGMRDRVDRRETAVLAEMFFSVFMIVQLSLVVLLTPAYVAGAIAEEKDRKTLEFMLATDLNNREIVLSKLLSRLANLTLLLLTGLPILSILQFLGGVDANLMLAGFAATGLTTLGIASVGILFSTLFQKPRDSIGLTYLFIVAFLSLTTFGKSLTWGGAPFMGDPIIFFLEGTLTWTEASDFINVGNPIAVIGEVAMAIDRATLAADLPGLLTNYAIFHLTLSAICVGWSIARLRSIALSQTVGGATKKVSIWERYRPPIGDLPMFWKELHIEGKMKLNWLAWGVVLVLVLLTIGTGLFIIGAFIWDSLFQRGLQWRNLSEAMNVWFRVAGTGVACLMLLIVAVRASTSIASERERDTFDALLTTPMSAETILWAKLVGALTSLRLAWVWFGCMVTIAVLTGGVHLLAVPILVVSWFVYAVFFAMLGMWFSMACQSSMRATVYTVLMSLLFGGGHWILVGLLCYLPTMLIARGGPDVFLEYAAKFQAAMTPPIVLGLYAYSWENLAQDFRRESDVKHLLVLSLFGLVLWSAACVVMWYGMLVPKFRQVTRREELLYE